MADVTTIAERIAAYVIDKVGTMRYVQLQDIRAALADVSHEDLDSALTMLARLQTVGAVVNGTAVKVEGCLAPESSRSRNLPEWEAAAWRFGKAQRADMIAFQPAED